MNQKKENNPLQLALAFLSGEEKYPTAAHSSHLILPKRGGKKTETLVKFTSPPRYKLTKR